MTAYSLVKHQEKTCIIPTTSNPKHHAQHICDMPVCFFNLHTTMKLPPVGKEYMCFHIYDKSAQAAKCVKSSIIHKVVDYVLSVNTFENKCVMLKGMLQSPHLKYHMKTVGIYQSLGNSALF